MFPHHENEVAQSECRHGKPQAKYWFHNGLVQATTEVGKIGGRNTRELTAEEQIEEKEGKSKGAKPFSELLKKFDGETIRFFLLSTHYRSPISYSLELIQDAGTALGNFHRFFQRYQRVTGESFYSRAPLTHRTEGEFDPGDDATRRQVHHERQRFLEAMDDDFNTGGAIASLFELVRLLNKHADAEKLEEPAVRQPSALNTFQQGVRTLRELTGTLGLFQTPVEAPSTGDDALVGKLLDLFITIRAEVRAEAKQSKNKKLFELADGIRKSLGELGVILEDRPTGTEWTIQRGT